MPVRNSRRDSSAIDHFGSLVRRHVRVGGRPRQSCINREKNEEFHEFSVYIRPRRFMLSKMPRSAGKRRVPPPSPEYLKFLSAYEPGITRLALAVRALVLEEAPEALELVYDAYNAVAAGYSFTGRPGDAFIHIAAYAHWVNLGFHRGSELDDPEGLLQGSGRWIRHVRMRMPADIGRPEVRAFVRAAVARAKRPEGAMEQAGKSVVRAVYPKRRRPAGIEKY